MSTRPYQIVVYGATGFTGRQAAAYLAAHAPQGLRWAIAGRSLDKLQAVRDTLGRDVPILVADSSEPSSVDDMVAMTDVICTTAGPFARYGDPVVSAAVVHGTHYTDITGETPWVRSLIDRFHGAAAEKGTKIVPFCGFDSIPSDLGTYMLVQYAREQGLGPVTDVLATFSMRGGINGGTIASALTMAETGAGRQIGDRRLLCPGEEVPTAPDRRSVTWDEDRKRWLIPFVMAAINTRVVRRSTALFNHTDTPYGALRYDEAMETSSRVGGTAMALGLGMVDQALRSPFGRSVVRRFTPPPGEGPSEAEMDGGFFRVRLTGTAGGKRISGMVSDKGDPGNRATVKMLMESTLALATETLPARGGVLTPSFAMGDALLRRLRAAGMVWTAGPFDAAQFASR